MNTSKRLFFALGLFFLAAGSALQAGENFKVITVDMAKLYSGYHKTEEAQKRFQERYETAAAELDKREGELRQIEGQFQDLVERAQNPALSAEARQRAEQEAQQLIGTARQKQQALHQFEQNTQEELERRSQTHREVILPEIKKVIIRIAKDKGGTLVLDTSGPTLLGISPVIYAESAYDITDQVLAELNADRPEVTSSGN